MIKLRRLGPAFVRHAEAYGELAAAAACALGAHARMRAVLLGCGAALAVATTTLAGATLIAAGWNSPYRYAIAVQVLATMGIAAGICMWRGLAALPPSAPMIALKDEWSKDKDWLSRELGS